MSRLFAIYHTPNVRSKTVCAAVADGMAAHGDRHEMIDERDWGGALDARFDGCAFYSLYGNLRTILTRVAAGGRPAIFIDIGYWNRKPVKTPTQRDVGSVYEGYHRFCIGERHARSTFQLRAHSSDRFRRQQELDPRIVVKSRQLNLEGHILLAGMQAKAAAMYDLQPNEYERWAIAEIKKHTDRRIVYRPKPSWDGATPLEGAEFSWRQRELIDDLRGAWAVVTHHSNVAIDALLEGVPALCTHDGLAKNMGATTLPVIEFAPFPEPEERQQFLYDVAYDQWSVPEMRSGLFWQHLKCEGLLETRGDATRMEA